VPGMPKTDDVIAVLCSDIHLSHLPPLVRSAEPNWYAAMRRPLEQIHTIAGQHACPVVCAGDIFDRWNSPNELVNFALTYLPPMIAVPGQHDLPNHNYEELNRSAYETVVLGGLIVPLNPAQPRRSVGCYLFGVPWGHAIPQLPREDAKILHVVVIHAYCWAGTCAIPNASPSAYYSKWERQLKVFDVGVFGDNHKGFHRGKILNCGTLMRRKADEISYAPAVGLLRRSGKIERHELDCSEDKFIEQAEEIAELKESQGLDLSLFVDELRELAPGSLDFRDAVHRVCADNGVAAPIRKIILGVLDEAGRI
jgi:hypothetical protein